MTITEYVRLCHENASKKGFHAQDNRDLETALDNSKECFERIRTQQMIKDIALAMTELAEAVEHARKKPLLSDKTIWKESIEEELADTVIRIFDISGQYGIDLEYFINEKMAYNINREYLHGKKL